MSSNEGRSRCNSRSINMETKEVLFTMNKWCTLLHSGMGTIGHLRSRIIPWGSGGVGYLQLFNCRLKGRILAGCVACGDSEVSLTT